MGISWVERGIYAFFVLILVLIFVAIGWGMYSDSKSPNISLKKEDWWCTKSETIIQAQLVGKTIISNSNQVCIEYRRK